MNPSNKTGFVICLFAVALALLVGCMESDAEKFGRLNRAGDAFYSRRDYKSAIASWKNALAIDQNNIKLLGKIAQSYLRLAEIENAAGIFKSILKQQPRALDARIELARVQLVAGDFEAAEANLAGIRKQAPNNAAGFMLEGDFLMLQDRFLEAQTAYLMALASDPGSQLALIKLATCYNAVGQKDRAKCAYQKAMAAAPENVELLLQIGNYWDLKGELDKAEQFYTRAAGLEPEDLALQIKLAEVYFDRQQNDKALSVVENVLEKSPNNTAAGKLCAAVLLANGNLDQAGEVLDRLYQSNSADIDIQLLKGRYHLMVWQPTAAVTYFKAVVDREPDIPLVHYLLGVAYLAAGQHQLGFQSLVKALSLDNSFADAELAIADYYYMTGAYDLSLDHAGRIAQEAPENYRAHLIMGNAYLAKGEHTNAMAKFRASQWLNPDSKSSHFFMAVAADLSGKAGAAEKLYRQLLDRHPDLADAAMQYADLMIRSGKTKEARHYFEKTVQLAPENGYAHHILGEIYLAEGNLEQGKTAFEKAVSADPGLAAAYLRLAQIFEAKGETDEQLRVLQTANENVPEFIDAYTALARIFRQKGQLEDAVAAVRTAVAVDPENPVLANNLASLYLEAGRDLNKAFDLAHLAYEKNPDDSAFADTLGWAYYHKGIYRQAIWYLREAVKLMADGSEESGKPGQKEQAMVHFHLGMALKAGGDEASGQKHLQKAAELGLGEREAVGQGTEVVRR